MAENKQKLFAEFPAVSTQEWMDKITADLKGADFDRKLVWKTNEGFSVQPLYRQEDIDGLATTDAAPGKFPYVRGTKTDNEWYVRQDILVESAKDANAKALDILNKGINSIGFVLKTKEVTAETLATLLDGIAVDCVEINFKIIVKSAVQFTTLFVEYCKSKGYDSEKVIGSICFDPFLRMLLVGKGMSKEDIASTGKSLVDVTSELPNFRVVSVTASVFSNAGAFVAQELGYALAWGSEYLSSLTEAGVDKSVAAKNIKFQFGVGGNYFMEIAKFRAARLLWAKIVDAYQADEDAAKMYTHAETSLFNKTIFDANVNMLRTQTEAMSATLGGVNSLTVQPYDVTYQTSNDFSERIARNQQLLLKEESNFDKVVDPSAGSYYIETLTKEIAAKAWDLFLSVEDEGGFYAAVNSGTVQKAIKETAATRLKAVSSRREILLGTNQFPNFTEVAGAKVTLKDDSSSDKSEVETLKPLRAAEEFEALRFETESAAKKPKAFMLTIGNLAFRLARAQFSCNFFACAGYEVIDNLGFKTVEEGVEAAQKAGADIIVLCSSDDEYAELAPAAFKAIGGKQQFVVAGAPACMDELKAQGIEYFVNVKSNVLETLKTFNSKLVK